MYAIWQVRNEFIREDDMLIYQILNKRWRLSQRFRIDTCKELFHVLQSISLPLEYAVIKMNTPYRNTFYYCCPHIKVIIDKNEVVTLFNRLMGEQIQVYEEVAVSVDYSFTNEVLKRESYSFIQQFYNQRTKAEAIEFYEIWQRNLPLGNKKISRFIRTMEFYFDEITNYFDIFTGNVKEPNN